MILRVLFEFPSLIQVLSRILALLPVPVSFPVQLPVPFFQVPALVLVPVH